MQPASLATMTAKDAILWRTQRSPGVCTPERVSIDQVDPRVSSSSSRSQSFRRLSSLRESLEGVSLEGASTHSSDVESVLSSRSTTTAFSSAPVGSVASPKNSLWGEGAFSEDSESSDGRCTLASGRARYARPPLPSGQSTPRCEPASIEAMPEAFQSIFSKCRHARHKEVQDLLSQGAPVDAQDDKGNTPLHAACQGGSLKTAKVLLRHGCETNFQNLQGNTPLHLCFAFGYEELGEYLIRKGGADIGIRNYSGAMPREGLGNKAPLRAPPSG
eukprot:CAMPEP_0181289842 /NCGR_PEP_ID=MMETSP1101-20121128/1099_1 /TAXON_ID=46948 /ORGANISM="Rhodomonas abbreviata, Strain Caron Lab Isolate" /LENGTH=273 /DNA_ID=CAMNT_0023394093 /DNA_START=164 /DNA_END=985 /DNA_ORIENTATION=-